MKSVFLIVALILMGCGYSSRNNESIEQAKKVVNQTPILCNDRVDADISLGVMRGGVGSMSTEDLWLTVPHESDQKLLIEAAAKGKLVKVNYDIKRITWCWNDHIVTHVETVN